MYLHKILTRDEIHWTNQMLLHLLAQNTGWARNISEKLVQYQLETNWDSIKVMTKAQWKKCVEEAVERANKEKLKNNCTKITGDGTVIKTKTRHIHQATSSTDFKRQPTKAILQGTKLKARTIIISRHGMLECGTNYKGTMSETCHTCGVIDNEDHRLNYCSVYSDTNQANHLTKFKFEDIHVDSDDILKPILNHIENVWDFRYTNGRMKKT